MPTPTLDPVVIDQEATRLSAELVPLVQAGTLVRVIDERTYLAAGEFGVRVKQAEKRVVDFFKPLKDAANRLHKEICARETAALQPIRATLMAIDASATTWRRQQEEKRRAEEARIREEVRQRDLAQRLADAAALEAKGHQQEADAAVAYAVYARPPVVVVPDTVPKVAGQSFKTVWRWRPVHNDRAAAVLVIPREYLTLDDAAITDLVNVTKDKTQVLGIEVYAVEIPVRRTGADGAP